MSTVSSNLSSLALEAFARVEIDLLARAPPLIPFAPTPVHIFAINQILLKHGTVIASLVVFRQIYDYLCTLDQELFDVHVEGLNVLGVSIAQGKSKLATVINFSAVFIQETISNTVRRSNSSWVHQLYKSGYLFYFYLIAINSLDIIFPIIAPVPLRTTFTDPQDGRDLYNWSGNGVDGRRRSRMSRRRSELESGTVFSTIVDMFATEDSFDEPLEVDVERITERLEYSINFKWNNGTIVMWFWDSKLAPTFVTRTS
ncbi:hypothetical protein GALMADRAFT_214427 [Galerina marginata CBS 339.88]|uniref:Uncharacterized protein n=1 Tax=Galerina marginata (strain CBS 339.88) TaxID=685588 RepID=A0A067SKZ4_GALM3|nr:hypothetical protein GALMADRAFT_214427 [Galerina marginata CBS 339.88]